MNQSGPDIAAIKCYTPDGCCGPSPCAISEDEFICQIRSLLPEGDLYNNTLPSTPPQIETDAIGSATVGCSIVGNQQLVLGGCCADENFCDTYVSAPQLAVVDSFAAVAYDAVKALCDMLRELDPCTAKETLRRWAERMGIINPNDYCAPAWSDDVLALLICIMPQIRFHVINADFLQRLAARFGASFTIRSAGDFNCGPSGWWTMARDRDDCPPADSCPPGLITNANALGWARLTPTCVGTPDSLNIVLCPSEITLPANCNNPPVPDTLPHDPELYDAFKWLLPQILPKPVYWCVYECDPANCIV